MALSLSQLEQYDLQAGWPAQLVPQAAAVEMAESSGDPTSVGPQWQGDQGSWGLFQVQSGAHSDLIQKYGRTALLSDPLVESKAGLDVYNSQGWGAWSAYTQGTYKTYLPAAQAAVGQQGTQPSSSAGAGSCDPNTGTWTDAKCSGVDLGCGVKNWSGGIACKVRWGVGRASIGGQMLLGLVVIAGGLWLLLRNTEVGRAIKQGAQGAGKVAIMAIPK